MLQQAVEDLVKIAKQMRAATKGKRDKDGNSFKFPNYDELKRPLEERELRVLKTKGIKIEEVEDNKPGFDL